MEQRTRNIFSDKATLILRSMIKQPDKKWVVRDFTGSQPISLGMASEVLLAMEKAGYIEREKKGAFSYTLLTNKNKLIQDWTKYYQFNLNTVKLFYNPELKLNTLKDFFKQRDIEDHYALTLHTGANFTTSYVKTENLYLYIDKSISDKVFLDFIQQLNLKQLVHGGNIFVVNPYYKNSVFYGSRRIRGFTVVSNLQLYLDLYHFKPRGSEHAEFLKEQLEQKGLALD